MSDPTPLSPLIYRLVRNALVGALPGLTITGDKLKWMGEVVLTGGETGNVGSETLPVYLKNGRITACSENIDCGKITDI